MGSGSKLRLAGGSFPFGGNVGSRRVAGSVRWARRDRSIDNERGGDTVFADEVFKIESSIETIARGTKTSCPPKYGRDVIRVLEAAHESAASGKERYVK